METLGNFTKFCLNRGSNFDTSCFRWAVKRQNDSSQQHVVEDDSKAPGNEHSMQEAELQEEESAESELKTGRS